MVPQTEIPVEVDSELVRRARASGREEPEIRAHEAEYRGEWIALDGERLIAHGKDGRPVARAASDAGVERPFLAFVEKDQLPPGGV